MYIIGVGADFAGISNLLSNELGLIVQALTHVAGVQSEKVLKDGSFGEFAACIGATMAPVHFSSEQEEEKGSGKGKGNMDSTHIALLACVGCILIGVVLVISSLIPYFSAKNRQKEYNAIIENLEPVYDVYVQYQTLMSKAEQLKALDKETVNRNKDIVSFVESLEAKMPTSFVLNDLAATAENITMNVSVATKEEAAAVLNELRKMEMFIYVDTTALSQVVTEVGETQYTFAVEMLYAPIVEETTEGEE
jgi:type IV pilus assembly protein PilM